MVLVAQMVRVSVCEAGGQEFDALLTPQAIKKINGGEVLKKAL
jgi:hypothetical protein